MMGTAGGVLEEGPASGQGSGIGIVDQVTAVAWGDLTATSEDQVNEIHRDLVKGAL